MICKLFSATASLALLISTLSNASAFTTKSKVTPLRPAPTFIKAAPVPSTHFTSSLYMSKDDEPYDTGYVTGSTTGAFLMAFVLLINIWIFSIPTEFRRARICKEEDVMMYPNKNCITAKEWTKGVGDYYKNGGGVQFDFSIEGR
jgi:hypothetical protein